VRRGGGLIFALPDGSTEPLHRLNASEFRIGEDERSPERILYETVIDGHAIGAIISGGGRFGRTFTP
jgi:hypothetical protein